MGMARLPGAVADPEEMTRGRVPAAACGVDAGQRLLIAEQQRLMAGVETRRPELVQTFRRQAAGAHESQAVADAVGQLHVTFAGGAVGEETERPLMHALQIGEAALGEGAQEVERRRRLAIGAHQPRRIGRARLGREGDVVDDVAAIARQLHAVLAFGRRRARLGELAGDAPELHHRAAARIGQHHGHLQENPEEIADRVGAMLGKALGAVAALQAETRRPAAASASSCFSSRASPAKTSGGKVASSASTAASAAASG